jgi:glycerol-3-phosphate cytidylyltransferase
MKRKVGYTQGVYDMFHVGHLNILMKAKEESDYLIVGVNSDELTERYKFKRPIVPEAERLEIIRAIKYVDEAVLVRTHDKFEAYKKYRYDMIFVGNDHIGEEKWKELERNLHDVGSKVVYLPYTKHTSSTKLRFVLDEKLTAKISRL